jgi:acetolactate decarboxylase
LIEESTIRSLHVEALRHGDLHQGHDDHVLFQASTVSALLDGAYDGDMTFAELAEEGDTGLGTLNGLDGEMIAFDGRFLRADEHGNLNEIEAFERTPFAVVTRFRADRTFQFEEPRSLAGLEELLDEDRSDSPVAVFRVEGSFRSVKARSVPKQRPPYRDLADVVADQNVFELGPVDGTLIGFRFPAWAEGVEIGGYHFHFADRELRRGGHVLDLTIESGTVLVQHADDLHVELPPDLELGSPDLADATHAAIGRVEHGN